MKALTICQPYAELVARGDKPIENRTWPTAYRGPIAIHAGKSREWLGDNDEEAALYAVDVRSIPFGAVVAVANLVACLKADDVAPWPNRWRHLRDHEHANGPWCWVLEDVRRLPRPVPYRGAQGLWDIPQSVVAVDPAGELAERDLSTRA
jgi:activating signal cointegrator 1